jgi:D-cysteine desulfhydrase/L-cysteate sulfo-lyase
MEQQRLPIEHIVIASGSSLSHSGLLLGLRVLGSKIPVTGVCVRRSAKLQFERVSQCTEALGQLLNLTRPTVVPEDIRVYDGTFAPGYGRLNSQIIEAIGLLGRTEGILLDPVYTGKSMAGLLALARAGNFDDLPGVLFIHTGGIPALFAYGPALINQLDRSPPI